MMNVKTNSLEVLTVTYAWMLCMIPWLHFAVIFIAGLASISGFNSRASLQKIQIVNSHNALFARPKFHKNVDSLYGPGQGTKPSEDDVPSKGMVIPQRPPRPRCGGHTTMETTNSLPSHQLHRRSNLHQPQSHQPHSGGYMASPMLSLGGTTANVLHPIIGAVVYAQVSGNAYPNS
ncbi:hypothetical protein HAX54_036472 [Datura stramonium]|uniref:Uncharacterized protein n=1 Tax=Datura stramonium TaxID=4076 RepID=A0ABS8VJY9_DATST|nr:hypothetical protein [Datura stramonium]